MADLDFHIVNRVREQVAGGGSKVAMRHKVHAEWAGISWNELGVQANLVSLGLLARGLKVQDKVGIYSNNMPRWTMADVGVLQARCVTVPIYPTNTPDQAAYIMHDAGVKVLFVGEQAQLDSALSKFDQCPELELIVAMSNSLDLRDHPSVVNWNQFIFMGGENEQVELNTRLEDKSLDDLYTLIYTSGTTGQPKGVMLDYTNLASQLKSHDSKLHMNYNDVSLCFLPLSHVFERTWTFYVMHRGAVNCYLQDTMKVRDALESVKPTVMCAVPRFYEKIFSAIHEKVARAPIHRKMIFTWAVNMGAKVVACRRKGVTPNFLLSNSYKLADKLVLKKLRSLLGGNIRYMPCGGAKLDVTIGRFFHAIGLNVKVGYGMTETTATVTMWDEHTFHPESIGRMIDGAEVKIGDKGEILVRGDMVMRGYYNMPEETESTFDEEGFLKTGDVGEIDDDGNLFITDRIKELMKTSGGKYIAPQVVEGVIGKDHFIEQIAVIADTRKFASALIVPSQEALEEYAKEFNIKYKDHIDLIKNSQVVEMLEKRVSELQKDLAKFEQVKKFKLLPKAFSIDDGELTPTQKLRRKVISERYNEEIEEMYKGDKPPASGKTDDK
ncbi:AMP-dependent synthetase/ligase [Vibrio crassostreae]|uniref:AMP-dependent synthetase/ligase n=1 Tax=Vibrio crassostreae TaxID=246167 RepID=UPI001B30C33E|nr:long-chain fatty acid--CoA ligase [Vibrio crassostreae]